ncbi:MAG: O-antigen ligase family protein [Aliihoeflea sp.]|uniref:O-antigen ligase family protein n=1 Tax=Aliihoeflea sp. TaxID=2608088 RepID=UPI00403373A0
MSAAVGTLPRAAIDAKIVALTSSVAVGLGVGLAGFVQNEPAPYELYMVALIGIWALFGLAISRTTAPLLVLWIVYLIGGMVSMTQMDDLKDTPLYLAVTAFLALTAVFVAAIVEKRAGLLRPIFIGWTLAACLTGLLGILGYFGAFPSADRFTLYDRAAGAFKDPNVFGPFLVLPAVWLLHGLVTGRLMKMPIQASGLLILSFAIFLSFSRGAWGLYALSALTVCAAVFLNSSSNKLRLRILVMALIGMGMIALAVMVALQIPQVATLFETRAQLVQDYDGARLGRFARYGLGFALAMEHPLGIGPLVFGTIFGEDTHNIWLKALMDYGWLGFAAYVSLLVFTVTAGFRILFRQRVWQPFLLCAWVVFIGHILLGTVIDMDHWRHFYLLMGIIWGCVGLEARHQASGSAASPSNSIAPRNYALALPRPTN